MSDVPDVTLSEELRAQGKCGVERFKDASCGYKGSEPWCDRTKACCAFLGNLERFDGALPDVKTPWELAWWDIVGGVGMTITMLARPPWWMALPLYSFFCFLILPLARETIYWQWIRLYHRRQDRKQAGHSGFFHNKD